MLTVNEGTSSWLTVTFKDKAGVLAAPSTLTYRIDCMTTGAAILAETTLAGPGSSVELHIPDELNAIQSPANALEYRRVTVVAVYGGGDQITSFYDYIITNLSFVPL